MPNNIGKQPKKSILNKIPYKKWWFWGAIVLVMAITIAVSSDNKTTKPEYYDNEKVDVNGLTIKEACKKVREKGWTVYEIDGLDDGGRSVEKSDCSDETHKVSRVSYHDDKSIWNHPSIELYFASGKKKENSNSNNNSNNNSNSNSNSNNEDKISKPESTPSASNANSNWKEILNGYEAWVDKYVTFMKKYKNASSSDMAAMMSDYSELLNQQKEWTNKLSDLRGKLSNSDLTQYLNTLTRINQKLSELY